MRETFLNKFEESNRLIEKLKDELSATVGKNQEYSDKMIMATTQAKSLREDLQAKFKDC